MRITLIHTRECPSIEAVIRFMRIVNTKEPAAARDVYQLHYLGWPDFGVPVSTTAIRELAYLTTHLRSSQPNAPCVVHCSAGVGRTGSFMGIICVLENPVFQEDVAHYQKKSYQLVTVTDDPSANFDEQLLSFISNRYQISEMVLSLRRQRNCGTVQTSKQYEFIYNALKDEIINPVPKEDIKTVLRPPLSSPSRPAESVRTPRNSRRCEEGTALVCL